jgi:SAM-dependent methyltransferase
MAVPAEDVYGLGPSDPESYQRLHLDQIRERWDRKASRWDADLEDPAFHLNEDDAYGRFLRAAAAVVQARRQFCASHGLLDLGCGTGLVLAHLLDRFAWGVGIDISERMLEVARSRNLPRARFVAGNCFEAASIVTGVGAAVSRGILLSHYGESWGRVLLEQLRSCVVAEGGFVLLDFLNAEARHLHPTAPPNKTYYSAGQVRRIGAGAGFGRCAILGDPGRRNLVALLES